MKLSSKIIKRLTFTDVLSTGKYKGKTVQEVLEDDPEHIAYLGAHVYEYFTVEVIDNAYERLGVPQ